jgi:hypothetical protein
MRRRLLSVEDFWAKVVKTPGCWRWTGGVHADGRGLGRVDGIQDMAQRIAWRLTYGFDSIEESRYLGSHCANPLCVRPFHHFLRGLSTAEVRELLEPYHQGVGNQAELAARAGVERSYLSRRFALLIKQRQAKPA